MRCIIDHFVDDRWAVLEYDGRQTFDCPRALLPAEAVEGDVIELRAAVDREETAKRRREIADLARQLFTDES